MKTSKVVTNLYLPMKTPLTVRKAQLARR